MNYEKEILRHDRILEQIKDANNKEELRDLCL